MNRIIVSWIVLLILLTISYSGCITNENDSDQIKDEKPKSFYDESFEWYNIYNQSEYSDAVSITTDKKGDLYVTGWIAEMYYGSYDVADERGPRDIFLMKLDQNGNVLYSKQWGYPEFNEGSLDIKLDHDNEIFIVGDTPSNNSIFMLKYSNSGDLIYNQFYEFPNSSSVDAISFDANNDILLVGYIKNIDIDILILKINSEGKLIWRRTYDFGSNESPSNIVTDSMNNIYITGKQDFNCLLIKLNQTGNVSFLKTWQNGDKTIGRGIFLYDSSIFISGWSYENDEVTTYLILLNYSLSGELVWAKIFNDADWAQGQNLFVEENTIYVTGSIIRDNNRSELLLISYDLNGNMIFIEEWGGADDELGRDLIIIGNYAYIVGHTDSVGNCAKAFIVKVKL